MSASQALKFILGTDSVSPFLLVLARSLAHCFRYREVSNLEGVGSPRAISVKDEEEGGEAKTTQLNPAEIEGVGFLAPMIYCCGYKARDIFWDCQPGACDLLQNVAYQYVLVSAQCVSSLNQKSSAQW